MTSKEGASIILKVIAKIASEGLTGEYAKDYIKALKSWFRHNQIQITQEFRVPRDSKGQSQEQIPMPAQFRKVLNTADLKQKVESTLMGFAGLRPETLGDYEGIDGLKVKDFLEMHIDNERQTVEFLKVPTMLVVRPNLSKAGHQYFTFYPEEGCQYLKEQLELRMRSGEELTGQSAVITSLRYLKAMLEEKDQHIRTSKVSDSIRTAIREAGFYWRPYILRSYFDTRMMMAEADRLIIKDWRAFWMGHKGDIEAEYTVKKGLPEDTIEQMRKAFAKASEKYLVTTTRREAMTEDAVRAQWNRQFLETMQFTEEEIGRIEKDNGDLAKLTAADINNLIQERSKKALGLNGNSQKTVPINEVEHYISEGWEYVTRIPQNKVVIRLPT
jgi:hypothetical protein